MLYDLNLLVFVNFSEMVIIIHSTIIFSAS